jgi:hypothetical protein
MDLKRKLTSRKFWLALVGFAVPVLTAYNVPQDKITQVTSIIMAGATLIAYILAEGFTDAMSDNGTDFFIEDDIEDYVPEEDGVE